MPVAKLGTFVNEHDSPKNSGTLASPAITRTTLASIEKATTSVENKTGSG